MTATERKHTLIEEGTAFKGNFESDCPILVNGRIDGNMSAPSVTVSSTGGVSGVVKVTELHSEGEIAGQYEADFVRLSGRVQDQTVIRAKALEVKLSRPDGPPEVLFGECELDVGEIPDKAAAVDAAENWKPPGSGPSGSNGGPSATDAPAAGASPAPDAATAPPAAVAAKAEEAKADEAKPDEAKANEAKANEAKPNEAKPNEAKPNEAEADEAEADEAKPEEAKADSDASDDDPDDDGDDSEDDDADDADDSDDGKPGAKRRRARRRRR